MRFIRENIAAIFILVLTGGFAWLFGGTMSNISRPVVPWLWLIMLEIAVCFPQRRGGESSRFARERVWQAIHDDPLTWVSVSFIVLMCIPFVNNALCPVCDAAKIANGADPGPCVGFLPYCVDRLRHYNVFLWFAPSLTAAILAKHSLTRAGKRHLVEMISWNGVALAVLGFVQQLANAPAPLWSDVIKTNSFFFSTFGYPNMAGDYFAILFCLSVAQWRRRMDDIRHEMSKTNGQTRIPNHKLFWKKHYMLIAALINFFAALNTLSRAAIIIVSSAAVILFAHAGVMALSRMKKAERVKAGAFCVLGLLLIAVAASAFMPDGVHREMQTIDSREALDRVTGRGEDHSSIATQIWREHLLFGCGGWGYMHLNVEKAPRRYWGPGSANVHNDHLQFLVEHGLVGYGLLVAVVVILLIPTARSWIRLSKASRFLPARRQPPPPQSLFALPGSAFSVLAAALVPVVHAFGDCPMRSPAVLCLFFVSLACVGGYLPKDDKEET